MAGIPPAVICNSLQDALKTAVGIEEVPPGGDEVCRLDARGHVLELIELGMSVEHIAESARVRCEAVEAIISGTASVAMADVDAMAQVEFELSDAEATALDLVHFTSLGATLREAIAWCRKRDGLSAQKAWAAVPVVKQRMEGLKSA
ncbi:hypothetical protein CHU72_08440 [Corynebacterium sp. LK12]|nr:hypothetical protein CHU72_08440 [Corynebacterium sp. LK12]